LEPGESKTVEFMLDDRSFAIWSEGWKIPGGTYTVQIGASSRDIRLEEAVEISSEEMAIPAWQAGSWYETLSGHPSREQWEKLMGHPVPVISEPKKGQFTMDSTCMEMKDHSFVMKIQYKVTEGIIAKGFGGKKDMSDPGYKMMITCATDCPMRSVVISSGGAMSDSLAEGLLYMANGHYIKGLAAMLKK
jgi:beta-glucosidase